MTADEIRQAIAERCATHPELLHPVDWDAYRRVCDREHIHVRVRELPNPAQLFHYMGRWRIQLSSNLDRAERVRQGLHELAHLWLHHDPAADRRERCRYIDCDLPDHPREREADLFAELLVDGAGATRGNPATIAALRSQISAVIGTPGPWRVRKPIPRKPRPISAEPLGLIIIAPGEGLPCDRCLDNAGMRLTWVEAWRALPHRGCRCAGGCRCLWERSLGPLTERELDALRG